MSEEQYRGCLELTGPQCAVHQCRSTNWIKSLLLHCSGSTSPHFGPLGWHFLLEHLLDINFYFQLNYSTIRSFSGPPPAASPYTAGISVYTWSRSFNCALNLFRLTSLLFVRWHRNKWHAEAFPVAAVWATVWSLPEQRLYWSLLKQLEKLDSSLWLACKRHFKGKV